MIGVSFLRLSATMKEIVKIKHFSRWRKDHLFSNIDQIQGTTVNRVCPSFFKDYLYGRERRQNDVFEVSQCRGGRRMSSSSGTERCFAPGIPRQLLITVYICSERDQIKTICGATDYYLVWQTFRITVIGSLS